MTVFIVETCNTSGRGGGGGVGSRDMLPQKILNSIEAWKYDFLLSGNEN